MKRFLTFLALGLVPTLVNAAPGGVSDDLRLWLRADMGIDSVDGGEVLVWPDQSGHGNDAVFNQTNGFGELPPRFDKINLGSNSNPSVHFDGQNALEIDLLGIFQSTPGEAPQEYTVFIVNSHDNDTEENFYLAGANSFGSSNLILGYVEPDVIRFSHSNDDERMILDGRIEALSESSVWSIDVFRFFEEDGAIIDNRQQYNQEIYRDGRLTTIGNPESSVAVVDGYTLGHKRTFTGESWFEGDLSEVIIYDRALTDAEQSAIEQELAERYARPLNSRVVESPWTNSKPMIDGLVKEGMWGDAGTFQMNQGRTNRGTVRFSNDQENLYLLIDLVADVVNDPNSDQFYLLVDTNENEQIDESGDLWYTFAPGIDLYPAELYGPIPYAFSKCVENCPPTPSKLGTETFGISPWLNVPHRIFEVSLGLDEIQAESGDTIRIGVWSGSDEPRFLYVFPPEMFLDFERMIEVRLARPTVKELIFKDTFEGE